MEQVIQVEGLTFSYAGAPVLQRTGFGVNSGDYVGIVGSNGAGKSTLLRLLLGELSPQEGTIRLLGQPVTANRDWAGVGYVPQNGAVFAAGFPANALEIVEANLYATAARLPWRRRGLRQQALEALAQVGMEQQARSLIGELSGGQLQRVLLARALVAKPRLLLLDEPATGVDAQSTVRLYQLLGELSRQGMTVVMVTHDMLRAADYMDRVFCLERGSLVELSREQLAHELEHMHRHP